MVCALVSRLRDSDELLYELFLKTTSGRYESGNRVFSQIAGSFKVIGAGTTLRSLAAAWNLFTDTRRLPTGRSPGAGGAHTEIRSSKPAPPHKPGPWPAGPPVRKRPT